MFTRMLAVTSALLIAIILTSLPTFADDADVCADGHTPLTLVGPWAPKPADKPQLIVTTRNIASFTAIADEDAGIIRITACASDADWEIVASDGTGYTQRWTAKTIQALQFLPIASLSTVE